MLLLMASGCGDTRQGAEKDNAK